MRLSDIVEDLLYGKDGYYTNMVFIGKKGDFFTAPHTSPLFGYTIGKFLKDRGVRTLVEVGGGEGYLMKDILEFTDIEGFIYEISPRLIDIQRENLKDFGDRFKHIEGYISADAYLLNEVIDALPFNRYIFKDGKWWEYVFEDGEVKIIENSPEDFNLPVFEGFIYDETHNLNEFISGIFANTSRVLIIDYGYDDDEFPIFAPDGTMSGYSKHRVYYGFEALKKGMDITHFVNFSRIKRLGLKNGFEVKSYMPQSEFLIKNGIIEIFNSFDEERKMKFAGGLKTLLFQFKNHRVMYLERFQP